MFQTEFVTYAHGHLVQSLVQPVCYLTAYLTHTNYKLPCCLAWMWNGGDQNTSV